MVITNEAKHTLVFHLRNTSALTYCLPRLVSDFLKVHAVRLVFIILRNIDIKIRDNDKDKSRAFSHFKSQLTVICSATFRRNAG